MRSHAKASTAGSTQRQAGGFGRFVRGVDAVRDTSLDGKGRTASAGLRIALRAGVLVTLLTLLVGVGIAHAAAPVIPATTVSAVTSKAAVLEADIDPEGEATTFHFEYGLADCASSPCAHLPVPDSNVGSGSAPVRIRKEVEGLSPGTTYHFRVVATNGTASTEGPDRMLHTYPILVPNTDCANQAFRVGPAANLPDCRAYEMVSPVDKNGGEIRTEGSVLGNRPELNQSAISGDKITYSSWKPFGDQPAGRYSNQYLATRGSGGWSTHGINAPQGTTLSDPFYNPGQETAAQFEAFTGDLSTGWVRDQNEKPLVPGAIEDSVHWNLYRRDNANDNYEALTVGAPSVIESEDTFGLELQGHSADGSHSVFVARAALTPDAAANTNQQIYDFHDGQPHLVSVLPNGEANSTEDSHLAGSVFGVLLARLFSFRPDVVSRDGSRIFWISGPESAQTGKIFVRINGQSTVPVSESVTAGVTRYWGASGDGSKALFGVPSGSPADPFEDLYSFDVNSETPTLVAHEVKGVAGTSDDLSHIYFVSKEVLDAGATAGEYNFYLDQEGVKSFIATVSAQDAASTDGTISGSGMASTASTHHNSRVTPDGRNVTFMSNRSLTGYDNAGAENGIPAMEVYTYDADTQALICASCNPSGARPITRPQQLPFWDPGFEFTDATGEDGEPIWTAAWLTTAPEANYEPHTLSEDGNRIFFNSYDALLPQDTNGQQDVYQWEAQGSGDCQEVGGCISLISTGESPRISEFIDASPDGHDAFFATAGSIDPDDPGLVDIYDARIGGGFPRPGSPSPCVGDSCQTVPPAPDDATPASANFRGAGNLKVRGSCAGQARAAAELSRRAKSLRRRAEHSSSAKQAKALHRRSVRLATKAKGLSRSVTRCRHTSRRVGR